MTHSPPVPPANQSPYPREEPPHDHHEAPKPKLKAPSKHRPQADDRVRTIVVAALGAGAVAALVAGIVVATRQPPAPRRKHKDGHGKKK